VDDLIKLVAVAIVNGDWEDLPDLHKVLAMSQAKRVIAAINREHVVVPWVQTQEMKNAGFLAHVDGMDCYEAMLRASPYYVEIE